ncbi:probable Epoxide hydrolase, member of the alpha/beta hydrolase fold family [Zygosaccharomyces bailii ISA1307]|nr:probable Epoxide hydrolase, member of the alpha/beta hydrolase fold family [Zygosaccharomyces bailii ISA1307]
MASLENSKIISPVFRLASIENHIRIAYRTAGKPDNPVILLLHGFPTSSNMFRNLIPLLAAKYYVVAPDLPGFGFTEIPETYQFSFEKLTDTIEAFLRILNISSYALYLFDYGSPVGFRLALKNPSKIMGIIAQNGNAYEIGLESAFWDPIKEYWKHDQTDPEFMESLSAYLQDENNVISQYTRGVADIYSVDPAGYTLDNALLKRIGQIPIQIKLFYDYRNNVELYPEFQKFLREANPPLLVVWGRNDTIFSLKGAEAYRSDAKSVKIVYYETGHFALETHVSEITQEISTYFYDKLNNRP